MTEYNESLQKIQRLNCVKYSSDSYKIPFNIFFNVKKKKKGGGGILQAWQSLLALPALAPTCWRTSMFLSPRNNTFCFPKQITYIIYLGQLVTTNILSVWEEQLLTLKKSNQKFRTQRHKEDRITLRESVEHISELWKPDKFRHYKQPFDFVTNPVLSHVI